MVTWTVEDTPWQLLSLLMNRSYLNCLSSGRSAGEQRARQGPCSAFKLNSKSAINTMLWEHYTQFHHSQYRCLIHAICSQQMSSACGTWQMVASGVLRPVHIFNAARDIFLPVCGCWCACSRYRNPNLLRTVSRDIIKLLLTSI